MVYVRGPISRAQVKQFAGWCAVKAMRQTRAAFGIWLVWVTSWALLRRLASSLAKPLVEVGW